MRGWFTVVYKEVPALVGTLHHRYHVETQLAEMPQHLIQWLFIIWKNSRAYQAD